MNWIKTPLSSIIIYPLMYSTCSKSKSPFTSILAFVLNVILFCLHANMSLTVFKNVHEFQFVPIVSDDNMHLTHLFVQNLMTHVSLMMFASCDVTGCFAFSVFKCPLKCLLELRSGDSGGKSMIVGTPWSSLIFK